MQQDSHPSCLGQSSRSRDLWSFRPCAPPPALAFCLLQTQSFGAESALGAWAGMSVSWGQDACWLLIYKAKN